MILLDSLYINIGGGKILLDYLVEELESRNLNVFYLFDKRCEGEYLNIPSTRKKFLKANIINRYSFYKKNRFKFKSVLCFGNVPPPIKIGHTSKIFTYFHQPLFIGDGDMNNLLSRIFIYAKTSYINIVKNNTDYWLIQNSRIKSGLVRKYKIPQSSIKIVPFFQPLPLSTKSKIEKTFSYISMAPPHKNHIRLIKAWEFLNEKGIRPTLHLTVPEDCVQIIDLINQAKLKGVRIINHGYINRNEVSDILNSTQYLVFPSLAESFGLPLVEAIEAGCNVIAADLDYTFQVIEPSYTFDPNSSKSIADAVIYSLNNELKPSKAKVKNEINELINLLK